MIKVKEFKEGVDLKGYISGMPEDYYHNTKGFISKSSLSSLDKETPFRFFNGKKKEPTQAMKMGTALHCAILEPEKFDASYILIPDVKAKTLKEYKDTVKENPEMEVQSLPAWLRAFSRLHPKPALQYRCRRTFSPPLSPSVT